MSPDRDVVASGASDPGPARPGPEGTRPDPATGRSPVGRRVAVVAPMQVELRPFVRLAHLRVDPVTKRQALRLWRGRIGTTEIVAARIGMGPGPAAAATRTLLDVVEVDDVVIMGVAGGLAPAARVGEVVVPAVVVDGETGAQYRPSSSLLAGAVGMILTTTSPATGPTAHLEWVARGYDAVDMESSGVAMVCDHRGVPWAVVRAISDRPDHGIVDEEVVALTRSDGTTDPLALARFLLRRPGRIVDLITLGRGLRSATGAAAETVRAACAGAGGAGGAAI